MVIGYDLDSPTWKLKGWQAAVAFAAGTGVAAMALAVGMAFQPQRVRLGQQWVKDGTGRVGKITPATNLPPKDLARWLRRRCFAEIEAEARREDQETSGRADEDSDDGRWRLLHASMSEFSTRGAIHPCAPAGMRGPPYSPGEGPAPEEFFAALAEGALTERERGALRLHLDGHGEREIAAQLQCSDRTVRRDLDRIKAKARQFHPTVSSSGSQPPMTHEGLRKITRPMTADEWTDYCVGYPASKYRRRKPRLAEVVPLVQPGRSAVQQPVDTEGKQVA